MNILDPFIPSLEITSSEEDIIHGVFSNPVVRKYLATLGASTCKELLSLSTLDESPESLMRKHTLVSGRLEILITLINIGVSQ